MLVRLGLERSEGATISEAAVVLDGWLRVVLLGLVWTAAIVGIALKFALARVKTSLSVASDAVQRLEAFRRATAPALSGG